jgi:hypothetical protein
MAMDLARNELKEEDMVILVYLIDSQDKMPVLAKIIEIEDEKIIVAVFVNGLDGIHPVFKLFSSEQHMEKR